MSAAVGILSGVALAFEVLLVRLLSLMQGQFLVPMIISLALLGVGVSGVALWWGRQWVARRFTAVFLLAACALGVTVSATHIVGQTLRFNPLEIMWDAGQWPVLGAYYLLFSIPFFCSGTCIGMALTLGRFQERRVYRADLIGAGSGAVLALGLLLWLRPEDALRLLTSAAFAAAALGCWALLERPRLASGGLLAAGLLLGLLIPEGWMRPALSEYKGLSRALLIPETEVIVERSGPLGLAQAVAFRRIPPRFAPGLSLRCPHAPGPQYGLYLDGESRGVIPEVSPSSYLDCLPSALAYTLVEERGRVLVAGGIGGLGVLEALHHGAGQIDVVETHPAVATLVRELAERDATGVFAEERVRIHVATPRSFLAGREASYDLIRFWSLGSTPAALGGQGIEEDFSSTVEALETYLRHLSRDGLLMMYQWMRSPPFETLKRVATVREALDRLGVSDPQAHIVLVRSQNTSVLLVKRAPITGEEQVRLREQAAALGFELLHTGSSGAAFAVLLGADPGSLYDRYKFHIRPATDDSPFFTRFFKWSALSELLALRMQGGAPLLQWGYLTRVATLGQATLAGLLLLVLPLAIMTRRRQPWPSRGRATCFFAVLGLGFLFFEIALIQALTLLLGHPLYAVGFVLSAFLLSAGLGAGLAGRMSLTAVTGSIVVLALCFAPLLTPLLRSLMGLPLAARMGIAFAVAALPAFFMGMPFPLGLARLTREAPGWTPWAWAVNGFASVVSPLLAALVAIHFGYRAVMLAAAGLYLVALLAGRSWSPKQHLR